MTKAQLRAAARPALPDRRHPRRRARGRPALHPPGRGLRRHGVPAGPRPRPRRPAARRGWSGPRRRCGPTPRCSRSSRRGRGSSRCRPPWCSPACCATWCATPPSARWWRRSSRTRPGPSGSSRSSPRPRSTRPTARTTCRSTPTCPSTTPRARRGRSSRRASPRRGRWPRSSRCPPPTRRGGSRCCPCYLFYSMFGFQRVGDLAWLLGDMRGRGILAGCTAGRTTLDGRGAAARRRAVAAAGLHQSRRRGLRRLVRLRGGRDHGGGRDRDARSRPQGPLLVPHALQRDLPDAGAARGSGGRGRPPGHHRRRLPLRRRRPRRRATSGRRCASRGRCGASPSRPSACWRSATASAPTPGP